MAEGNQIRRSTPPKRRRCTGSGSSLLFNHHEGISVPSDSYVTPKILSSPQRVFEVIRRFDERKKEIVRSIGFGGLLSLPRLGDLDNKFTIWLLKQIRWNTSALVVGNKINFVIRAEHIGKIIGIPYSGLEVNEKIFENDDDRTAFLKHRLSFLGSGCHLLEAAESYLGHDLPFRCSKDDSHKFRMAFVIFVMGRFLAPYVEKDEPTPDFWGALKNPDSIHSFNWSSFVVSGILEASRSVVWAGLQQKNVSAILGCPLILQILYLDNIELGHLKLQHDLIPRVKNFNCAVLRKMIEADYLNEDPTTGLPIFGRAQVLRADNTCYNISNVFKRAIGSTMTPPTTPSHTMITTMKAPESSLTTPKHDDNINVQTPKPPADPQIANILPDTSTIYPCKVEQAFPKKPPHAAPVVQSSDLNHHIRAADFSGIMRDYFKGQIDNSLFGFFNFHQAMCVRHITKFCDALKDAVTTENISLVCKLVNHHRRSNGLSDINIDKSSSSALRRTYDDMLSGAESGNEVEDTTPAPSSDKFARCFTGTVISERQGSSHKQGPLQRSTPFPSRSSFHNTVDCIDHTSDKSNFTTPLNKTLKPTFDLAMDSITPKQSPTSVNKIFSDANLSARFMGRAHVVDLNERNLDAEYSSSPIPKIKAEPVKLAISHWAMNIDHPTRDLALTHTFYAWISTTTSSELNRPWIMHESPRYITILGNVLKDNFTDIQPIGYDVFDICIRRLSQLDKAMCPTGVKLRWRHLLESDFSMHVLGGENPANNASIKQQFLSSHLDYELSKCRMFFVPVHVNGLWWCYAWDMKCCILTINDPSIGEESDEIVIKKHAGTIGLLSRYLQRTILDLYSGWFPPFEQCNYVVHRTPDMPIERSQSGFFNLFFIKNFNGTNLISSTSHIALQNFKEYMLYEILELKDNLVKPPNGYIHSIDD